MHGNKITSNYLTKKKINNKEFTFDVAFSGYEFNIQADRLWWLDLGANYAQRGR